MRASICLRTQIRYAGRYVRFDVREPAASYIRVSNWRLALSIWSSGSISATGEPLTNALNVLQCVG